MDLKKDQEKTIYAALMNGSYQFDGNKSPAFQLYINEFLIGTISMNPEEVGAYILLLLHQWDLFGLPQNKSDLSDLGRCNELVITKLLKKFTECPDGKLRNSKLEKIRAAQIVSRKEKSKSGSLGAEARYGVKPETIKAPIIQQQLPAGTADFFYIGRTLFKIPVSKYINDNLQIFLSSWQVKNPTLKAETILAQMDKEKVGHEYTDEAHIKNSFSLTAKQMAKPTYNKVNNNNQPEQPAKQGFALRSQRKNG